MYAISETRTLSTKSKSGELYVVINDFVSGQTVELSPTRWAAFRVEFDNISAAVKALKENQYVKFFHGIGDDWYVSVTTGFLCVDIRRFFKKKDGELKPTRDGIALKLHEWKNLLTSVLVMDTDLAVFGVYVDDKEQCVCCDHLLKFSTAA